MKLDREELLEKVNQYAWYHVIDLGHGIKTNGYVKLNDQQAVVNQVMAKVDFAGKRVLDIGCRDGQYSFDAERRGAAEVIGVDNMLSKGAVELLIPHFGSKVKMHEMNLYDLTPGKFGLFDVIIFPGVLYHLRYPFSALKIIRGLLKDDGVLILETGVLRSHAHSNLEKLALLHCPIDKESPYEATSVTFFNTKGMIDSLKTLGFQTLSHYYMHDEVSGKTMSLRKKLKLAFRKLRKGYLIDRITLVCKASVYGEAGVSKYWDDTYASKDIERLKNPDHR